MSERHTQTWAINPYRSWNPDKDFLVIVVSPYRWHGWPDAIDLLHLCCRVGGMFPDLPGALGALPHARKVASKDTIE